MRLKNNDPEKSGLILDLHLGREVVITHGGETLKIQVMETRNTKTSLKFIGPRSFVCLRSELEVKHESDAL